MDLQLLCGLEHLNILTASSITANMQARNVIFKLWKKFSNAGVLVFYDVNYRVFLFKIIYFFRWLS